MRRAYFARLQICVFAHVHPVLHEQVYLGDAEWAGDEEGEGQDPLGNVVCMECGRGDDEDNLMLCDGASCTFCSIGSHFATGAWYIAASVLDDQFGTPSGF